MSPFQTPIRIVAADDHELFRDGLAGIIESCADLKLIAQATNGEQLLALVDIHRPDVVVTDIKMDIIDGIQATSRISARFPDTAVICLSMYSQSYSIMNMLKAGAIGYVLKIASRDIVLEAIRAAARGEKYYCRSTAEKIKALVAAGRFDLRTMEIYDFTPLQLRIIKMICAGMNCRAMANALHVSLDGIKKHRVQILEKAGVKNTTELMVYAAENGMISE